MNENLKLEKNERQIMVFLNMCSNGSRQENEEKIKKLF